MKQTPTQIQSLIIQLRQLSKSAVPTDKFSDQLQKDINAKIIAQKPSTFSSLLAIFTSNVKFRTTAASFLLVFVTLSLIFSPTNISPTDPKFTGTKDDWILDSNTGVLEKAKLNLSQIGTSGIGSAPIYSATSNSPTAESSDLGFAVGGAKSVENFRRNIQDGFLPLASDITYEGLFYDYYFDNDTSAFGPACEKLFCPAYSVAVSNDPFTNQPEYFLAVGLKSGMKESDFQRKKLNLVLVLDVSGSMDSGFGYYYDKNKNQSGTSSDNKAKLEHAKVALYGLIDKLEPGDSLSIVTFDDNAYLAKPLNPIGDIDVKKLKSHISELRTLGSTNMEAGYKLASKQLNPKLEADSTVYENRIIFITDAMPNTGDTSSESLSAMVSSNADKQIFTTFIGVGVDFNSDLIEQLTKAKGANYYSIHSGEEFVKKLADEFDYMVTPLVFDLQLNLESDSFEIEAVYGTGTDENELTNQLIKINTLFPSKTVDGQVKGGIVLVKLHPIWTQEGNSPIDLRSQDLQLKLNVSYKTRSGQVEASSLNVDDFKSISEESYQTTGIRKAILLSRYTNLMHAWILSENNNITYRDTPCTIKECGIPPYVITDQAPISQWERTSKKLMLSNSSIAREIVEFKIYFENEKTALEDATLQQEIDIMQSILYARANKF